MRAALLLVLAVAAGACALGERRSVFVCGGGDRLRASCMTFCALSDFCYQKVPLALSLPSPSVPRCLLGASGCHVSIMHAGYDFVSLLCCCVVCCCGWVSFVLFVSFDAQQWFLSQAARWRHPPRYALLRLFVVSPTNEPCTLGLVLPQAQGRSV
jgi:hypothetical protein